MQTLRYFYSALRIYSSIIINKISKNVKKKSMDFFSFFFLRPSDVFFRDGLTFELPSFPVYFFKLKRWASFHDARYKY